MSPLFIVGLLLLVSVVGAFLGLGAESRPNWERPEQPPQRQL